jgi:hypothetical protein
LARCIVDVGTGERVVVALHEHRYLWRAVDLQAFIVDPHIVGQYSNATQHVNT